MKISRPLGLALLGAWWLAACLGPAPTPAPTLPPPLLTTATPVPPTPTPVPPLTAEEAVTAYLQNWEKQDYAAMHQQLAPASQSAWPAVDFTRQYTRNLEIMTATSLTTTVLAVTHTTESAALAQVQLFFHTMLIGDVQTQVTLPLEKTGANWGVVYSPAIIWPDLVDGKQLYMVPFVPDRGIFYDRNGVAMVETTEVYAVGLVPGELSEESNVPGGLARLFGIPLPNLQARMAAALPDDYLAIGEIAANDIPARSQWLIGAEATRWTKYNARYYRGNGALAHVGGYTSFIPPAELPAYLAQGYASDQRLGSAGLELWGEPLLHGTNGGQLTLLDAQGQPLAALVIKQPTYPADIYTTLDFDLQSATQFALGEFTAAAVVLNRDTGEILALASSPTFDPNLFEPQNLNRQFMGGGSAESFFDQATQGAYAAGSIFKVVTFAAGLTSELFTPETEYQCNGLFTEAAGVTLTDWLEGGHGRITLAQGLSSSCNPYFWRVGLALHNYNPQWLPDTAKAFGLGQPTGLLQLPEAPGRIPDPDYKRQTTGVAWELLDSLNLAIGQGDMQVTPLQMARLAAAVGNGGTLLEPQLIAKIQAADGTVSDEFVPVEVGKLPLTAEQLVALQLAMYNTTRPPIGTARNRFTNLPSWLKVAGKTGTAEAPGLLADPHAWFIGYTFAEREDKPDIAIAVWVGNRGQGSDFAAPIFRRILEAYYGLSYRLYPWEESIGVVATPEPTPTEGPAETETPAP